MGRPFSFGYLFWLLLACHWSASCVVVSFFFPSSPTSFAHPCAASRARRDAQQRLYLLRATKRQPRHHAFAPQLRESSSAIESEDNERAKDDPLWTELVERFQGDFDNYEQVLEDRAAGMLPREGGGHENIHCTLVPLSSNTRLAAFYFDGTPSAIFRFRFYELRPAKGGEGRDDEFAVDTILYTLHPDLEAQLRQASDSPLTWPSIFHSFDDSQGETSRIRLLPKCDVRWSWHRDPVLHSYAWKYDKKVVSGGGKRGIHAVMVNGQAEVDSQLMPGQRILIKDQLSIWQDALWIHDRGFDPATGNFIYGNQRNVPYQLKRVTSISSPVEAVTEQEEKQQQLPQRNITYQDLAWTLGVDFRVPEEYETKIEGMGGPSVSRQR